MICFDNKINDELCFLVSRVIPPLLREQTWNDEKHKAEIHILAQSKKKDNEKRTDDKTVSIILLV